MSTTKTCIGRISAVYRPYIGRVQAVYRPSLISPFPSNGYKTFPLKFPLFQVPTDNRFLVWTLSRSGPELNVTCNMQLVYHTTEYESWGCTDFNNELWFSNIDTASISYRILSRKFKAAYFDLCMNLYFKPPLSLLKPRCTQ